MAAGNGYYLAPQRHQTRLAIGLEIVEISAHSASGGSWSAA
ncbi:hypothetical protein ABZ402_09955 [Streptomyces mirabilis]